MEVYFEVVEIIFIKIIEYNGINRFCCFLRKRCCGSEFTYRFLFGIFGSKVFFEGIELVRNILDRSFFFIDLYFLVLVGSLRMVFRGFLREILK